VFSLGLILFEILTLQRARDPRTLYQAVEARPSVRRPDLNIAPELEAICVKATQPLADERYSSARAIQEAVARYLEGDRDREQRRTLAENHAERAREALARTDESGDNEQEAMRYLMRALALDPTNREHVAMLADIIGTPPRTKPPEIAKQLEDNAQDLVRAGGRYGAVAMASWFLFLPFVLWLGIRRLDYTLAIAIPVALTGALGFLSSRRARNGIVVQCIAMLTLVVAGMMVSRLFGPLVLVPTLFAAWAIVSQAYPYAFLRKFALLTSMLAVAVPLVLEMAGVIPPSYSFANGRFEVLPQMTDLPRVPVLAFLGVASIATAFVPALFVARLRGELAQAQEREMMQDWKLRRMRDDLLRAKSQPS
jgi:serine/threonine-protein kinase